MGSLQQLIAHIYAKKNGAFLYQTDPLFLFLNHNAPRLPIATRNLFIYMYPDVKNKPKKFLFWLTHCPTTLIFFFFFFFVQQSRLFVTIVLNANILINPRPIGYSVSARFLFFFPLTLLICISFAQKNVYCTPTTQLMYDQLLSFNITFFLKLK